MSQVHDAHATAPTFSTAIADAKNYMNWITSKFSPFLEGRILEIGIGHGCYFDYLKQFGPYLGIDIDHELVLAAQRRYRDADFAVADITSTSFTTLVPHASVDSIVCCNVLEHIADDRSAVANLLETLKPGGNLLLLVPALGYLYSDLDRLAGHHRRYDKKMMGRVLAGMPGTVMLMHYFNPIGGLAWWVNRLVRHESLDSPAVNRQIYMFDKFVLPFSRAIDPVTRRFFGQSLIVVLKKS